MHVRVQRCTPRFCSLRSCFHLWTKIFTTALYSKGNNCKRKQQPLLKGYKVTLYSDSLRATALYAIYRNSPTWVVQRDSVNTAIIHSYLTEPFGSAESVDSVWELSVTCETDLVLWVGPSWRVDTSENITLQTSIGLSAILCIADSLNTTSELRMICLCSGS